VIAREVFSAESLFDGNKLVFNISPNPIEDFNFPQVNQTQGVIARGLDIHNTDGLTVELWTFLAAITGWDFAIYNRLTSFLANNVPKNQPIFYIGDNSTYISFTTFNGTIDSAFYTNFQIRYVVNNLPVLLFSDPK
jgi:hypothetical protein